MLKALLMSLAAIAALAALVRTFEPRAAFFPTRGESSTPAELGIPFEATTIRTRDGERLHAWLLPQDRPRGFVLYFHVNGGNLSIWLPIFAGIHGQDYTV